MSVSACVCVCVCVCVCSHVCGHVSVSGCGHTCECVSTQTEIATKTGNNLAIKYKQVVFLCNLDLFNLGLLECPNKR